jgi:hypothetical protein
MIVVGGSLHEGSAANPRLVECLDALGGGLAALGLALSCLRYPWDDSVFPPDEQRRRLANGEATALARRDSAGVF